MKKEASGSTLKGSEGKHLEEGGGGSKKGLQVGGAGVKMIPEKCDQKY